MRLWLIKLLRTTSVKSVRLSFSHSYTSIIASVMLLMLVILIITLSDTPIAPSLILLFIAGKLAIGKGLFFPSLKGEAEFTSSSYTVADKVHPIRSVNYLVMAFVLLIEREDRKRVLVWRDSVSEASYRHLVVMLKREY